MTEKSAHKTILSNLPTMHTDGVNIACRIDGCILLQLVSDTPDGLIENIRTVMTRDSALELINNLAISLDYFPVKELPKPSRAKKSAKPSIDSNPAD